METEEPNINVPRLLALIRSCRPVCRVLAAVYFLVWLAMEYVAAQWGLARPVDLAVNFNPPVWSGETWRLLVSPFVHDGGMHVAIVLMNLLFFGPIAEELLGTARFLLLCVWAACLAQLASLALGSTPTCGGSPIVMAILGTLGLGLTMRQAEFDVTVRVTLAVSLLAAILLVGALPLAGIAVNEASHVGGLIAGFMIAPILLQKPNPGVGREAPGLKAVMLSSIVVMVACLLWLATQPRAEEMTLWLEQRAIEAYQAEQYAEAGSLASKALDQTPDEPTAAYLLGFAEYQQGHPDRTEAWFRQAVAHHAEWTEGWDKLAQLALEECQPDKALRWLKEESVLMPHDPNVCIWRGDALSMQGHPEAAADAYRLALTMKGADPDAHLHLGQTYLQAGELTAARHEFEAAGDTIESAVALATLNVLEDRPDPDKPLQQVLMRGEDSVPALMWEENYQARQLREGDALRLLHRARQDDPDSPDMLLHLADLWHDLGLTDACHHCCDLILRQSIRNQSLQVAHANAALLRDDPQSAAVLLRPALEACQHDVGALTVDAHVQQALHHFDKAQDDLRSLITDHPSTFDYWFELGWTRWHLHQLAGASACFDRAAALARDASSVALSKGYLALLQGDKTQARQQAGLILQHYPAHVQALELSSASEPGEAAGH